MKHDRNPAAEERVSLRRFGYFAWLLPALVSSCIAAPHVVDSKEATALLEALAEQSEQIQATREAGEAAAIKAVRVETEVGSGDLLLTLDVENADIAQLMSEILSHSSIEYRADRVRFSGRTSARLIRKPLVDALNILLANSAIDVVETDGIVLFEHGDLNPNPDFKLNTSSGVETAIVSREVELMHITSDDVVELIGSLFPANELFETEPVSVGSLPELNSVFLSGPPDIVEEAISVIARADRPVAHVIIEVLVVEINTSSVESLGLSFEDAADGKFSAASIIPGQTGGNIVATFSDLAANSAQVTATIDFLAAHNVAEVLARPYIATQSTKPASIEIVDDQFARVDASNDDASIITIDSVAAGISMQITPVVMAGDSIRLDLNLEDSRFGAAAADILITKQRNTAATSMIVNSGQTIMIGGLNSRYRLTENSGLPWLRNIPVLSAFAGSQDAFESRIELAVYLTPYIWTPSLNTPLPLKGTPTPVIPEPLSLEGGTLLRGGPD